MTTDSPVESFLYRDTPLLVKRDDLLNPCYNGNKARKFHFLLQGKKKYKQIISYGGVQSNAMHALSFLSKELGAEFLYLVKSIPKHLRTSPYGNYKVALENGMQIKELGYDDFYEKLESYKHMGEETLFVNQGGYCKESESGVKLLAEELQVYFKTHGIEDANILLSSGTGTTALYLQKNLVQKVFTVACVGDSAYLKNEFTHLEPSLTNYPTILEITEKIRFGIPHRRLLEKYLELQKIGLEIDLLYDAKLFLALDENIGVLSSKPLVFIHSGGISGNESMLQRYKEKKFL